MKIGIVGAGIMGLSTAWALSRAEPRPQVTLFDQGPIPNPDASSHDVHRIIRYPYRDAIGYQQMVASAYPSWELMWRDLGVAHYHETGTLCLGDEAPSLLSVTEAALGARGLPVHRLTRAELAARFPWIAAERVPAALYLASGGALFADRIVTSLAGLLAARGVALRPHTEVRAVDPERGTVTLASGAVEGFDQIVVSAGAWAPRLLPGLAYKDGRPAQASRQLVAYLDFPASHAASWAAAPVILDIDRRSGYYALPPVGGTGLKIGDHTYTLQGDPSADRTATEAEKAAFQPVLDGFLSQLRDSRGYTVSRYKTCFYTAEPDSQFIVKPIGAAGWAMSPCSGHGFKFGALLGRAMARALTHGDFPEITEWAAGELPDIEPVL